MGGKKKKQAASSSHDDEVFLQLAVVNAGIDELKSELSKLHIKVDSLIHALAGQPDSSQKLVVSQESSQSSVDRWASMDVPNLHAESTPASSNRAPGPVAASSLKSSHRGPEPVAMSRPHCVEVCVSFAICLNSNW